MVMTYCDEHFTMYTNGKSLFCTPETNITLYVNICMYIYTHAYLKVKVAQLCLTLCNPME